MIDMILFPSSYFDITKIDEDLQDEYYAAMSTDLFEIIFFDYNKWFHEGKLMLNKIPSEIHTVIYRGWMMKPEQYEAFYLLLLNKNIKLITEPFQYKQMHLFPNIYNFIKEDTAKIKTYPLYKQIDVIQLKQSFQKFIVKDYVKSVKGTEFPKYFDSSITQEDFDKWMEIFYKYRGNLLTGGICIKEFFDLKLYGSKTNEYRVFYINHKPATVSRNSVQKIDTPLPPKSLIEKYKELDSFYYTIDYAELKDGSWKIIETGDGSVSGLSENQDYEQYYRALFQCFK